MKTELHNYILTIYNPIDGALSLNKNVLSIAQNLYHYFNLNQGLGIVIDGTIVNSSVLPVDVNKSHFYKFYYLVSKHISFSNWIYLCSLILEGRKHDYPTFYEYLLNSEHIIDHTKDKDAKELNIELFAANVFLTEADPIQSEQVQQHFDKIENYFLLHRKSAKNFFNCKKLHIYGSLPLDEYILKYINDSIADESNKFAVNTHIIHSNHTSIRKYFYDYFIDTIDSIITRVVKIRRGATYDLIPNTKPIIFYDRCKNSS